MYVVRYYSNVMTIPGIHTLFTVHAEGDIGRKGSSTMKTQKRVNNNDCYRAVKKHTLDSEVTHDNFGNKRTIYSATMTRRI